MAAPTTGATARYARLFGRRSFRYFFVSFGLGEAGYAVYAIGVLWLAVTVSHSALVTGLVLAVEFGVYSLSFLAGPIIDRTRDLRTILVIGYPVQAALALLLGVLALEGLLTVPLLFLLIVALSIVWDFTWTALNAALPRIVASDELFLANGLTGAVSGGNQIAGYAAGAGLLLLVGSPAVGMLLYGVLNATAAVASLAVRAPRAPSPPSRLPDEYREGWRYLVGTRSPPVRAVVAFSCAQGLFSAAGPLLITILTFRTFADPARSFSLLFTAFAVGGVAGNLVLGQISPRAYAGRLLVGATVLEGLLLIVAVAAAPSIAWSLPTWAAVGFVDVGFYTTVVVFFQAATPAPLVGRTLSNAYLFRGSSRAAGALLIGALAATLAPFPLGVLIGGAFVAVGLIAPAASPAIARLRF
ncbi:MAG TPA: MFS transporter [Thermoplasmata archaeon]